MPTINGHKVDFGCLVDGHHGQYAPDMLADIAEGWGWVAVDDLDPRSCRIFAESLPDAPAVADWWEHYHAATEQLKQWINDHADGVLLMWSDGEVFLGPVCRFCGTPVWDDAGSWVDDSDGDACSGDDDGTNENEPHRVDQ